MIMNKEKLFVIIAALCILAIAVFMIGGMVQDVDYHALSDLSLLEQKVAYDGMQVRVKVGETMQLAGAILALSGFAAITVISLSVGHNSAKEAEKRYSKNEE